MRVLIAFDKFKECMSAQVACSTATEALQDVIPEAEAISAPICDGGEGFCDILCSARKGHFVLLDAQGPRGEPRRAAIGLVEASKLDKELRIQLGYDASQGKLAIVEMAQASGLWGLPVNLRDPNKATSRGTGQMLAEAADAGARAILLGIGGSASSDLGLGALEALGLRFHDRAGRELRGICPGMWDSVYTIGGRLRPLPRYRWPAMCTTPCLVQMARRLFRPTEGTSSADVPAATPGPGA
jgi:glycerate kinase